MPRSRFQSRTLPFLLVVLVVLSTVAPVAALARADTLSATAVGPSDTRAVGPTTLALDPTADRSVRIASTSDGPTLADQHTPDGPVVDERYTFERDERPGVVRLRLRYDVPASVTAFELRLPGLGGSTVSLVDSEGFERDGTTLRWTGATPTSTLDLRLAVTTDHVEVGGRGVERDGWAFATAPDVGVSLTYTGARPRFVSTTTVAGTGYATDRMALLGTHDRTEVRVEGERVTFVVGNATDAVDLSDARAFLERAPGRFDFGVRRDRLVVFVLPPDATAGAGETRVTGEAYGDAFWVTAAATRVERPANAFAHEYVHSRLTGVGNGSAAWLTEATAEYYGYLSTLNTGGGSFEEFYAATTAPEYASNRTAVTLSQPRTWRGTLGDYEKGAHVLAALDAEIRARTDGERTLYDVFVATRNFDDYGAFRAQVVETADDESLGPWLDRYVTTDALPPVPDDPARYVLGPDLDPDDDGLTSERELAATPVTNPFAADTDGDGLDDGREREVGSDPTSADTDDDGVPDGRELATGTDPTSADTDGDGATDAVDPAPTDPSVRVTEQTAGEETVQAARTATPGATGAATATSVDVTATGTPTGENGPVERVETPGFGVVQALVAAVAGATLVGMLCRRQNRGSP